MRQEFTHPIDSDAAEIAAIFDSLRTIQARFVGLYGVDDIWSNSKIFEVVIANALGHSMIPGHSGSLDAEDDKGNEYEYKHFKERSSNHSWTFNDYSDSTIDKLRNKTHAVVFAHINDEAWPAVLDWAYILPGPVVAEYLTVNTRGRANKRKMINVSERQIVEKTASMKQLFAQRFSDGPYGDELLQIFPLAQRLQQLVGVSNILTSNKLWEVLVSIPLGHRVNSEQGGRLGAHDAMCAEGRDYEYKVSKSRSWNFQDISPAVLKKYEACEEIVLAIVDKSRIEVEEIWFARPERVIPLLEEKLERRRAKAERQGTSLRRLQVSLTAGDVSRVAARRVV